MALTGLEIDHSESRESIRKRAKTCSRMQQYYIRSLRKEASLSDLKVCTNWKVNLENLCSTSVYIVQRRMQFWNILVRNY